jgi:hypothetical protein
MLQAFNNLRPQACAIPTMLPSVRPTPTNVAATHVVPALHTPSPFCGSARPRASAQCCARATPSRHHAQAGSPPDAMETSSHSVHTAQDGSPAAASRRSLLLGAAAAVAATLAGEHQAHAVQGLTAGRLPGMDATRSASRAHCSICITCISLGQEASMGSMSKSSQVTGHKGLPCVMQA